MANQKFKTARGFNRLVVLQREMQKASALKFAAEHELDPTDYKYSEIKDGVEAHIFKVDGILIRKTEGV